MVGVGTLDLAASVECCSDRCANPNRNELVPFSKQNPGPGTWLLTDGHAGNRRQTRALARALGLPSQSPVLAPAAPWRWFAPRRLPGDSRAFGATFHAALATPPQLAIGCGRQGALATRLLREAGARTIQILDPRLDPAHWDLVIAPAHDRLSGGNVIGLSGSLHPVDEVWLAAGRQAFAMFAALPSPRIAVLVGGPTRNAPWERAAFERLLAALDARLRQAGGSLLATTSRRTPVPVQAALRDMAARHPGECWDGQGTNPYAGLLAWADAIVCTPDSVNMLSEACATEVPVHVLDPHGTRGRLRRFIDDLQARARIAPFSADLLPFAVQPLRETARVAAEIRQRLPLPDR